MTAGRTPSALGGRGACLAAAIVASLFAIATSFALNFPALSGRVVDQANIIQPATRSAIEEKLAELEAKSGIQIAVATVGSLEGQDIEPYANELFRNWKLGEKTKNNGVLLLIAPNERRVRIEVGYGLEGMLTDALASTIISAAIIPRFKSGDLSRGIQHGVDGIISVLSGDTSDWQPKAAVRADGVAIGEAVAAIALLFFLLIAIVYGIMKHFGLIHPAGHYVRRGNRLVPVSANGSSRHSSNWSLGGSSSWSGSSSSDSSDSSSSSDSFSGGGGSSGGGGASGSW